MNPAATADCHLTATTGCYHLATRQERRATTRLPREVLRRHGLRAAQSSVVAAPAFGSPSPLGELTDAFGLEWRPEDR